MKINNPITIKLRDAGFTVRTWSLDHGFRQQTVRNFIINPEKDTQPGIQQRIKDALIKEGFHAE